MGIRATLVPECPVPYEVLSSTGSNPSPAIVQLEALANTSSFLATTAQTAANVAQASASSALAQLATLVIPAPASVAPGMDGTAVVGLSALYARQDHIHPLDTTRNFQTIASLRANGTIFGAAAGIAQVYGYYASTDGGGGYFVLVTTDTTSADNGGTIIVDLASQRWHRQTSGAFYSANWFGAKGDGATDDTTAINAALAAVGDGVVILPSPSYKILGTITIKNNGSRLHGAGRYATTLNFANGAADCITVNNGTIYVYGADIGHFGMTFSGKTGGRAVYFSYVGNCHMHDMQITAPYDGVDLYVTNTVVVERVAIISPTDTTGYALRWGAPGDGTARSDVLTCRDVTINCNFSGADGVRWYGLANTLYWFAGAILNTRYGLWVTNPSNSVSNVPLFFESYGLAIEGASAQAVRVEGGGQMRFIGSAISNLRGSSGQGSVDTNAVYIGADASYSITNSLKFIGCRIGLCGNEAVWCAGRSVQMLGCSFPTGSMSSVRTYAAVHFASPAQDVQVIGCTDYEWGAQTNYSFGVQLDAGVTHFDVQGNNFYADGTGPVVSNATSSFGKIANNTSTQFGYSTPSVAPTAVTATTGTTLTGANILGSVLSRTGPGAAFTDTTPTATQIVAAMSEPNINGSCRLMVINGSAFAMTIAAGAGVTITGVTSGGNFVIAAGSARYLEIVVTAVASGSQAVTIYG